MYKREFSQILEFARSEATADAYGFHVGRQSYILRGAGGGARVATLDWDEALLRDLAAVQRPGCEPVVAQRLGERLRGFLYSASWEGHESELQAALLRGETATLTLRSNAAELYALPWELLTVGTSGRCLGELPGVLIRYAWPETTTHPESLSPRPEGGRVLVACAGMVPAAEHIAAIERAHARGGHRFVRERDVLYSTSAAGLLAALRQRDREPVSVLHLLCHGGWRGPTFGLCLDGEDGAAGELIDAAWLRRNLAEFAGHTRFLVLCACDSGNQGVLGNHLGSVAQALHQVGFAAVLGSRFPLSAAGSVVLTEALYEELLGTLCSLEDAVRRARQRLIALRNLDWASLTLYARPQDDPSADGPADSRPLVVRPYRGLLSFQPEHQRFFFGRTAEIAEVQKSIATLTAAQHPRILVVAGASGSGKSSLVLAGVAPRLVAPEGEFQLVYLRPGRDPEAALQRALTDAAASAAPPLLCVDQFEEVFTQTEDAAARQRFVQRLWSLATEPDSRLLVILTLRIDFIGRCGELLLTPTGPRLDAVAFVDTHRVLITQLGREQLQSAIEEPAHLVGLRLEAGLAARMVHDCGGEPGTLPLLQDVLDLLWQKRSGRQLTQAAYEELGGVGGALHGRAERLVDSLNEDDQRLMRRLLEALVQLGSDATPITRRRVRKQELMPSEPEAAARFARLLLQLIDARLLLCQGGEHGEGEEVEVAHEALLRGWPRLTQWLRSDQRMLIELGELREWVAQWQKHQVVLMGTQLGYAEELLRRYPKDLPADAQRLIAVSREAQARQRRSARLLRDVIVGLILAASIGMSIQGLIARRVLGTARRSLAAAQAELAELRAHCLR